MKVYLIGVGMGNPDTLTWEAQDAIADSALLIGAPRLLEPYRDKPRRALIAAGDIAQEIAALHSGPVGVLLSGDVGFYSGAKKLWPLLEEYDVITIPGISSLSYFCARLRTSWQDIHIVSAHGRASDPAGAIQCHSRTFVLTGGQNGAGEICQTLCRRGMGQVAVAVGERLSYPDERILQGTAEELSGEPFDDLAVLLAENPAPVGRRYAAPGLPDSTFLRGEVPMTKEEIRTLVLSKLRLEADHILWDIGAGTGSVSIEGAMCLPAGRVYAIERNPDAVALLQENRERFGAVNLEIVSGMAPDVLADLPAPDRVFLGGTSGQLEASLKAIFSKNPSARIVMTAITLETLGAALNCWSQFELAETDIVQVAVTKTRKAGRYHMPEARNPIWILSGEGKP